MNFELISNRWIAFVCRLLERSSVEAVAYTEGSAPFQGTDLEGIEDVVRNF